MTIRCNYNRYNNKIKTKRKNVRLISRINNDIGIIKILCIAIPIVMVKYMFILKEMSQYLAIGQYKNKQFIKQLI